MTDKSQWPQWLCDAKTENAEVEIAKNGRVIWHNGNFWCGNFWDGSFLGGDFWGGNFWGGNFWGDAFRGGNFWGGDFRGGNFWGGSFRGGRWYPTAKWLVPTIDRLLYMAAMCGIVFDSDSYAVAYRSTRVGGKGRYKSTFIQPEGEWYDPKAAPAGSGTCRPGIHVTTQAQALTYFGIDSTAELWEVRFKREDLLDCDGEKARIRGGHFKRIPWPFYKVKEETNDEWLGGIWLEGLHPGQVF